MSSSSPQQFLSPVRNPVRPTSIDQRWTVDNSESRFHSLTSKSPAKSILKGPNTPNRFQTNLYLNEQERRFQQLDQIQRRVSFAQDASLRVFNRDDTLVFGKDDDVANLTQESEPDYDIDSPITMSQRAYSMAHLTGSPSDRRKRRPDLFGSPPGLRSPRRRLEEEEERTSSSPSQVFNKPQESISDLTQYLNTNDPTPRRRNIFDDDDFVEEEEEEEDDDMIITREFDMPAYSESRPIAPTAAAAEEEEEEEEEEENDDMDITGDNLNLFTPPPPTVTDRSPMYNQRRSLTPTSLFSPMRQKAVSLFKKDISPPKPSPPMLLIDFLELVNIDFTKDQDTRALRRRSTYENNFGTSGIKEDVLAFATILPQINCYKNMINKVNETIQKDKESILALEKQMNEENPILFKEYQASSVPRQRIIRDQLTDLKRYAELMTAKEWYLYYIKMLDALAEELKAKQAKLKEDKGMIQDYDAKLQAKVEGLYSYEAELKRQLNAYKEFSKVDSGQLKLLNDEIKSQDDLLSEFEGKIEALAHTEIELEKKKKRLEQEKEQLANKTKEIQDKLSQHSQKITRSDLIKIRDEYQQVEQLLKYTLTQPTEIILDHTVRVGFDEKDKITKWSLMPDNKLAKFTNMFSHGMSSIETVQDCSIYVNTIKWIQTELSFVKHRFDTKIEETETGIKCQVELVTYSGKTKFILSFEYTSLHVTSFPVDTISLEISYGSTLEYDDLFRLVKNTLQEEGIGGLVDTLIEILNRVSVPW